jgi:integrase
LHPVLAAHLLNWRRETPYSRQEDLVFPSLLLKRSKPPSANMLLSDHLRPAEATIGIVAPARVFGFHTFRRTLVSVLVANNYDPKLVQELLRHSNIKTTLDIYAQAITPAKKLEAQGVFLTQLFKVPPKEEKRKQRTTSISSGGFCGNNVGWKKSANLLSA